MKQAIENRDAESLNDYVDYPTLRENLRATLSASMMKQMSKLDDNPFAALGVAIGSSLVNQMVDTMVTPEGLRMIMQGERPSVAQAQERNTTNAKTDVSPERQVEVQAHYDTFNRFSLRARRLDATKDQEIVLVFLRSGLCTWKLSRINLPQL